MDKVKIEILYVNEQEVFGFLLKRGGFKESEFVPSNVLFCSKDFLSNFLLLSHMTEREVLSFNQSFKLNRNLEQQVLLVEYEDFFYDYTSGKLSEQYLDLPFLILVLIDSQENLYDYLDRIRYRAKEDYQLYSLSEILQYREEHQFPFDKIKNISQTVNEQHRWVIKENEEQAYFKSLEDSMESDKDLPLVEVKSDCNQLVNQKGESQLEEMRKLSDKVEENNSSIEDCKAQVKVIEEMQLVQFFLLLVIMFLLILGLFPF